MAVFNRPIFHTDIISYKCKLESFTMYNRHELYAYTLYGCIPDSFLISAGYWHWCGHSDMFSQQMVLNIAPWRAPLPSLNMSYSGQSSQKATRKVAGALLIFMVRLLAFINFKHVFCVGKTPYKGWHCKIYQCNLRGVCYNRDFLDLKIPSFLDLKFPSFQTSRKSTYIFFVMTICRTNVCRVARQVRKLTMRDISPVVISRCPKFATSSKVKLCDPLRLSFRLIGLDAVA